MYKSDFKYTPSPNRNPCYKGHECKHKAETTGMCRFECEDYIKYQALVDERNAINEKNFSNSDYRSKDESLSLWRFK